MKNMQSMRDTHLPFYIYGLLNVSNVPGSAFTCFVLVEKHGKRKGGADFYLA